HVLVQDAAYGTLLREPRRALHARIADTLQSQFAEIAENQPALLAHHYKEAGLLESAIECWLKAGKSAESRSANIEAVKALTQGIEMMQSLPPSSQSMGKELDFYLALGPAMAATRGFGAPETQKVFLHARDLLADGGTVSERMTVLWGAYLAHRTRAENIAAREVAHQILALASQDEHPGISALGHRFMGQALLMMGAFVEARFHLQQVVDLCAAQPETITAYRRFGVDDQAIALSMLSGTLWALGYPERAAATARQALARARTLGLTFTTAQVLETHAFFGALGADPEGAADYVTELIAHSIKHSLAELEQRARFTQGALLIKKGYPRQAIEIMHSVI